MFLENFNFLHLIFFVILIIIGITFIYLIVKKQNKYLSHIFLFISFIFIIINIFGIKSFKNFGGNGIGGNIVFVLDVSKSMNTIDVENNKKLTSRLELSKDIIKNFIINNSNNNFALSVFAGETLEILPFTSNSSIFIKILNGINNNNVSKNGSELSGVFDSISDFFKNDKNGTVVIFTDGGEDDIKVLEKKVEQIKTSKINVLIVGIGTIKGSYVPEGYDVWGNLIYKNYKGEKVLSRLNKKSLDEIISKFKFNSFYISSNNQEKSLNNIINSIIEKNTIVNNESNNSYLTRFFIFLSFIFFILFLFFDNFIGKK